MNFFRVVKEVCLGTTIFQEIENYSLRRTFCHLLFLAFWLALAVAVCQYVGMNRFRERLEPAMTKEFGELAATPTGLRPQLKPEQSRTLAVTSRLILNYFPGSEIKTDELRTGQYEAGVIWTPGAVVCWQNKGGGSFFVWPFVVDTGARISIRDLFPSSPAGIASLVKKFYHPIVMEPPLSFHSLLMGLLGGYAGAIFLISFLRIIGLVLLFNTLFTGCYSMAGGATSTGMTFKKIFTIGVYAGFPALIVASIIPAFDIDLVDFNTVYLFGFLAYFLFVFSRIQRQRIQERWGKKMQGDDDDDDD